MGLVKPKKFLGQHFLRDLGIAGDIADTVDTCPELPILEVGPGMGVGANAAHPLHQSNGLDEVALLTQLFNAPVVVTDKHFGIGNALAVHNQLGVNGLLQRRMVRADGNGITHKNLLVKKGTNSDCFVKVFIIISYLITLFYPFFRYKVNIFAPFI